MQATVALVLARPETIVDDYRRVMSLAGIDDSFFDGRPALVAARPGSGWFPGTATPPWQLDGVLAAMEGSRSGLESPLAGVGHGTGSAGGEWSLAAVDSSGGGLVDPAGGWAWQDVLARHGATQAKVSQWDRSPVHPQRPLPSLTAALPDGLRFPTPLQGRPVLLLPVLRLMPEWPLAGSVAMLQGLHGRVRRNLKAPLSEVRAECVALAREMFPVLGTVMDATVIGVTRGHGTEPVARNVLLAGDDPVAVDAVAARLVGLEPRSIPWLRLCGDRKLGAVNQADIQLVGSRELVDLDFQIPPATLGSAGPRFRGLSGGGWFWQRFQKPRILNKYRSSPWGRLFQEYKESRTQGTDRGME